MLQTRPSGRIDVPQARLVDLPGGMPPGAQVRAGFDLVKMPRPGTNGPLEWLIEGPVPEPHVSINTAIRFLTELRARAKDEAIRKNADNTIAALKRIVPPQF